MRDVLKNSKPDLIFVHGDTTTSTAASLAVFYQQIPVAHVEAGLRTGNIYSTWPEEMNRQITGRIATINFSPTQLSRKNLLKENIADNKIVVTGNTVIDALHWVTSRINNDQELKNNLTIELKEKGYDTSILIISAIWYRRSGRMVPPVSRCRIFHSGDVVPHQISFFDILVHQRV